MPWQGLGARAFYGVRGGPVCTFSYLLAEKQLSIGHVNVTDRHVQGRGGCRCMERDSMGCHGARLEATNQNMSRISRRRTDHAMWKCTDIAYHVPHRMSAVPFSNVTAGTLGGLTAPPDTARSYLQKNGSLVGIDLDYFAHTGQCFAVESNSSKEVCFLLKVYHLKILH